MSLHMMCRIWVNYIMSDRTAFLLSSRIIRKSYIHDSDSTPFWHVSRPRDIFCDSHLDLISSKFVWGFTKLQKVHLELKSESNVDMAQNIQQNNSMLYL